jgi:hypothetical protein
VGPALIVGSDEVGEWVDVKAQLNLIKNMVRSLSYFDAVHPHLCSKNVGYF